jgi:Major Facilitator Superfamily
MGGAVAELAIDDAADAALVQSTLGGSAVATTALSGVDRRRIALYFAGLIVLLGFPENLTNIPVSFFLKNKLHLAAHQIALFGLIAAIPIYCAMAFGFVRDIVNPFGRGDRGFIVLAGAAGAVACVGFSFLTPSVGVLLAAALTLAVSLLFVRSAVRGLIGSLGQQNAATGQASALVSALETIPVVGAILAGGLLSDALEQYAPAESARILFLACAALLAAVALYGLLKPASVFAHVHRERMTGVHPAADLRRLVRHTPIYPALLIWLLWQFVPGLGTPMQFFMQNTLHFRDSQYGLWWALYVGGAAPAYVLFGFLCRRFPLRTLLLWGTVAAAPMMLPLLFIRDAPFAIAAAAPMDLLGGVAGAAFFDLIIRSCPPGLQGTVLMASTALFSIDGQFGNVLGSALFDHFHDFTVCVIAMTTTNLLILPALLLVPRSLTATADGQLPQAATTQPS